MSQGNWLTYTLTVLLLAITPGPAVVLVSALGIRYGIKGSCLAALGVAAGTLLYFSLSVVGLGTLILTAGNLFEYIKVLGGLYLIATGFLMVYKTLENERSTIINPVNNSNFASFIQGFVIHVSNPNVLIFFILVLPRFIDISQNVSQQFIILGITTIKIEILVLIFYGWTAAQGKKLIGGNTAFQKWQNRISGFVLVGLGVYLFFMKSNPQ